MAQLLIAYALVLAEQAVGRAKTARTLEALANMYALTAPSTTTRGRRHCRHCRIDAAANRNRDEPA